MNTNTIDVVAAIIFNEHRLLATKRPEGRDYAGYLEFPGGKIEPGETPEQALIRELKEELDITPRTFDFLLEKSHSYPEFSVRLLFFSVKSFSGTPTPMEGQTFTWLNPEKADPEAFLPADRDILNHLAHFKFEQNLKLK